MVSFIDLFLERINRIIELYLGFLLSNKEQLIEEGKTLASRIEVELYELKQKAVDFDKIRDNQKRNYKKQGEKNNGCAI